MCVALPQQNACIFIVFYFAFRNIISNMSLLLLFFFSLILLKSLRIIEDRRSHKRTPLEYKCRIYFSFFIFVLVFFLALINDFNAFQYSYMFSNYVIIRWYNDQTANYNDNLVNKSFWWNVHCEHQWALILIGLPEIVVYNFSYSGKLYFFQIIVHFQVDYE